MDDTKPVGNSGNNTKNSIPVHFVGRQEQSWNDKGNAAAQRGD